MTNDDGPPDQLISPFVFDFVQHLKNQLGWDVRVCLPSSQRSWSVLHSCEASIIPDCSLCLLVCYSSRIGKAYFINKPVQLLYAQVKPGLQYTTTLSRRPLEADEQEWILLE